MVVVVVGNKSSRGSSRLCARRNNTGVPITRNLGPPEQTACSRKQRNTTESDPRHRQSLQSD